ncbi:GNAT family N-acetyltransferase [Streptococcus sp. CF9-1]|uniref:GNAT family N-acetyltransferase n=1 Tax=unclassified Streptococcus TaxID=2608887 RepID=UPI0020C93019|nr:MULTISPECIES: GNAT family N-acetyltransferase [unclassified Streptococcus]MCP8993780.1 GNAT family N-acetyltransferase [Streptococcus sp. CF9-3]MCP8997164.1 GNAT family N-acetyltransferase [Streptococcus sp. CF9-1]
MEFPIKIREVQQSDIEQVCLMQESTQNFQETFKREIIEERIRNFADTFLLASLDDQVIAYILVTDFATSSVSRWIAEMADVEAISNENLVIDALSVHPNYQGQGFGTLLLAAMKQVALQKNSPGIYLLCKDEFLSYFEMNEFIEQGIADLGVGNEVNFLMSWKNPFYQEEL